MPSHLDQIEQLNRLRKDGALTRAEFEDEKRRILSGAQPAAPGAVTREERSLLWLWIALGGVAFLVLAGVVAYLNFRDIQPAGDPYKLPQRDAARLNKLDDVIPLNGSAAAPLPSPAPSPTPSPTMAYPQFQSSIPRAFRGNWDEMIADGCDGREPRFSIGATTLDNFEVPWEVTRVKIVSPTEIEVSTTMKDEDANQQDRTWQFRLADGGRTLTARASGSAFYRRCPRASG